MTRRNFIKTGLIFVPSAALAYPVVFPSSLQQRFNCNLPPSFPGLKYWVHPFSGAFKDAAKTQLCQDGDQVNTWQDANGFADFAQSTVANQPIYRRSKWSAMPSVEFGASTTIELIASHANIAQDFSWHAVLQMNVLPGGVAIFFGGTVGPNFAQIACNPTDPTPYIYAGSPITAGTLLNVNRTYYWSAYLNGASSSVWYNGKQSTLSGNIGTNGTQSTSLGAPSFTPPNMQIYEFMLYKPSLSDANRLLLEESFRLRYGLPIGIT